MDFGPIEIFYDGFQIEKYGELDFIKGVTTNCSIFSKSGHKSYLAFYNKYKSCFSKKPLSLQIWSDEPNEMIEQVKAIHSLDSSIYVKVPIVNTKGEYTEAVIQYCVDEKIPINITIIHTKEQLEKAYEIVKNADIPIIISVFAGPISDTLVDVEEYVRYAVKLFKGKTNCKILYAGCRELYTIKRANDLGCHIITIPDVIMERLSFVGENLQETTLRRARMFHDDAKKGGFTILE